MQCPTVKHICHPNVVRFVENRQKTLDVWFVDNRRLGFNGTKQHSFSCWFARSVMRFRWHGLTNSHVAWPFRCKTAIYSLFFSGKETDEGTKFPGRGKMFMQPDLVAVIFCVWVASVGNASIVGTGKWRSAWTVGKLSKLNWLAAKMPWANRSVLMGAMNFILITSNSSFVHVPVLDCSKFGTVPENSIIWKTTLQKE